MVRVTRLTGHFRQIEAYAHNWRRLLTLLTPLQLHRPPPFVETQHVRLGGGRFFSSNAVQAPTRNRATSLCALVSWYSLSLSLFYFVNRPRYFLLGVTDRHRLRVPGVSIKSVLLPTECPGYFFRSKGFGGCCQPRGSYEPRSKRTQILCAGTFYQV